MYKFILFFGVLSCIARGQLSQEDCGRCVEVAPPTPAGAKPLTCQEQKEMGKCERGWMEGYCVCTCGGCEQVGVVEEATPVNAITTGVGSVAPVNRVATGIDSDVVQTNSVASQSPSVAELLNILSMFPQQNTIPEPSPVETCECYDQPPSASKKTCQDMLEENQCEVMLLYEYCECTCGKCAQNTVSTETEPETETETTTSASSAAFESAGMYDEEPVPVNAVELVNGQKLANDDPTIQQQDQLLADLVRTVTTMQPSQAESAQAALSTVLPTVTTTSIPARVPVVTPAVQPLSLPVTPEVPEAEVTLPVTPVVPLPLPTAEVPVPAAPVVPQPLPLSTSDATLPVDPIDPIPTPTLIPAVQQPLPTPCLDILPPNSEFSCEGWKTQDKCDKTWMQGYCQFTCGTCNSVQTNNLVQLGGSNLPVVTPATPTLATPAPTLATPTLVTPTPTLANPSLVTPTPTLATPTPTSTPTLAPALLSSTPSYDDICKSTCNDNPPPKSQYTCAQQLKMGKCSRDWMTGYCECTCETCDAVHEFYGAEEQKSIRNPEISGGSQQAFEGAFAPVPVVPQVASGNADLVLTILHFNDIHARLMPATEWWWECEPWRNDQGECYGGFPRIKTIVDQHRSLEPNLLVLNGGDDFVGTDWDYHDPTNKATTHFLNQIGVDAMAIGNHEFDHGPDTLATFARNAQYPLLSCNMDASSEPNLAAATQKYTIQDISGHKVGIFGLTTTFTNTAKHADPRGVWFSDPNQAAKQCVQELQSQGVDIIIALSHLGFSADKYLAKQIDGIDIVVGSHSHTFLTPDGGKGPVLNRDNGNRDNAWDKYPTWIWSDYNRRVPVVQAGWATRYLGKITLEIDASGEVINAQGAPILLGGAKSDNNVPEDQTMKQELQQWKWW